MLDAGLPLVAFLQLVRVYGQALAQIADAEVKLFHLYVHEPMIRDGAPVLDIAEELSDLASRAAAAGRADHGLASTSGSCATSSSRTSSGTSRPSADDAALGRVRVAIAFADLAGYTRLTEEVGEEEALEVVERFVDAVERDAARRRARDQDDRRRGDGRRHRPAALADWAVGLRSRFARNLLGEFLRVNS